AAPFEEHHRMTHVLSIFLDIHQPHAGRLATLDLVLQARSGSIAVEAVFTLTNEKGLLQQAQAFADRTGTRIRAEVASRFLFRAAMNTQTREITAGEEDIRIGFIVAQEDVVGGAPLFDKRLFK